MDALTPMSTTLSPLKRNDDQQLLTFDECPEYNALKRQRLDCVDNQKSQPCASDDRTHGNARAMPTTDSASGATNGTKTAHNTIHSNKATNGFPNGISTHCAAQNGHSVDESIHISTDQVDKHTSSDRSGDRVIIGGQRRTRALSSDSIQSEFDQARKQQMLDHPCDPDLFDRDAYQSDCNAAAFTTHVPTTRGKSLSPPKVGSKRQAVCSNYVSRTTNQRHIARPFCFLRKQKILLKAKQQLRSPTNSTTMAKTIVKVEPATVKPVADKPSEKEEKANASDSEYSSLEDDDNVQDSVDSDDALSDLEESISDNKALYNSFKGVVCDDNVNFPMLADSVQGRYPKAGPLTPSLFANVPPYITFANHAEKGPDMPPAIRAVLKWKLTTITPQVIKKVLNNSGFRLLKQTNDFMGTWGKHMKTPCFRTLRSHQKINHIPGTFQIGRKDRIWRNLQTQMMRNGKKEFSFMPLTYILPQDVKRLKRLWSQFDQRDTKWIIKPPASARGTGIKVVSRWKQIPKRKPTIVQKYIDRPLLINGSKFDLRLYVLVTSLCPLRAYMHTDGLARFASVKYSNDVETLSDRYMHLTNYSINKLSSNYTKNEDAESCSGHKWTLKTLWKYLSAKNINTDGLWAALRNLVLRTVLSGEHVMQFAKANVGSRYNTFELFGIDVILDSELKPWLLEVNISPSLHSSSPLDLFVKGPLVTAVFNTARYNVPPRFNISQQSELMIDLGLQGHNLCFDRRLHVANVTKSEREKHTYFTTQVEHREQYLDAILENLTSDDVRCLIAAEDELARCAPLERICPTPNSHRYIKFTEKPRYYNRLLDAWEHRYSGRREEGIALLQRHCENRIHLIVPAACNKVIAKKATDNQKCSELSSENEIVQIIDASARNGTHVITNGAIIKDAPKIIDECKSPLPIPDDKINEPEQCDLLVSSIA